jgi:uncharacterized protein YgbK (DUF1537 family)
MSVMLIIADDLSGAADCGIACVAAGLETVVILGEMPEIPQADILAVDADTRGLAPGEAAAQTARMAHRYSHAETQFLFKKLDSTLRGNVGAEIAAILEVARSRPQARQAVAVVAPAFPATGRTTRGGHQMLHGMPVEQTETWRREGIGGRAHLPEMLGRHRLRTAAISLEAVRGGDLSAVMAASRQDCDALVCDAETEADLEAIARAGLSLGRDVVWAGSAGLARHLPAAAGLARPPREVTRLTVASPVLFVIGSLSRISRQQVAALAAVPEIEIVTVPPLALRAGSGSAVWTEQEARLDAAFATGHDVVALLGAEDQVDMREGLALCGALSRLVAPHAGRFGALVSTGGETARAVLQAFGAAGLRLVGEIEPGVPLSVIEGRHEFPVITKAGAFGSPQTLLRCRNFLRSGTLASSTQPTGSPS